MKKRIIAALLAGFFLCLVLALPVHCAKGFGDFDSGSDYGGSDSGGSDYGGSDYGDSDWGSSSSGSSRSRRSSSSNSDDAGAFFLGLLIIVGPFFLWKIKTHFESWSRMNSGTQRNTQEQNEAECRAKEERERKAREEYSRYRAAHPEFSELELFDYVKKLFIEMQEGWEAGDITNVRYGFVPDTWQRFDTQLSLKKQRGETTHVRDIRIRSITVIGFRELPVENREKISLRIVAEYNVWVTSSSGTCIQGSPSTRHLMTYVWTMERTPGVKKPEDMNHCPNCGAELDVSAFAECPFCHTKMMQAGSEWLLRDIQAESQKTVSK